MTTSASNARDLVPANSSQRDAVVLDAPQTAVTLMAQAEQVQRATAAPWSKVVRRWLFVWLRIYVHETKRGKETHVNLAIPIPLPFIGMAFRHHLTWDQAYMAARMAQEPDGASAVGRYLESCMALEMIRVEEEDADRDKRELVVIGLD